MCINKCLRSTSSRHHSEESGKIGVKYLRVKARLKPSLSAISMLPKDRAQSLGLLQIKFINSEVFYNKFTFTILIKVKTNLHTGRESPKSASHWAHTHIRSKHITLKIRRIRIRRASPPCVGWGYRMTKERPAFPLFSLLVVTQSCVYLELG